MKLAMMLEVDDDDMTFKVIRGQGQGQEMTCPLSGLFLNINLNYYYYYTVSGKKWDQ